MQHIAHLIADVCHIVVLSRCCSFSQRCWSLRSALMSDSTSAAHHSQGSQSQPDEILKAILLPSSSYFFSVSFKGGFPHSPSLPHNYASYPRGWYPPPGCSCWWLLHAAGWCTCLTPYCAPNRCGSQRQACASLQGYRLGQRIWWYLGGEAALRRGSTGWLSLCWGCYCRCGGIPPQCSFLASSASTSSEPLTAPLENTKQKQIWEMWWQKINLCMSRVLRNWGDSLLCWQNSTRWPQGDPKETTNTVFINSSQMK